MLVPRTTDNRFAIDDAKAAAYAKLELSDEAMSRGWINWSDTAILACREIVRLRAEREALIEAAQYVVDVQDTWGECTDAMLRLKALLPPPTPTERE